MMYKYIHILLSYLRMRIEHQSSVLEMSREFAFLIWL